MAGVPYINPNPHTLLFILNLGPLLLVDGRQPTSIGRHAERTGNLLQFVDRQINEGCQGISYPVTRAYTMQNSEVWFLSLDDEPIRGSQFPTHFASKTVKWLNFNEKSENTNYSTRNACGLAIFSNF
jgi:hypothetical protein